ncbi:30S ribosomal protein S10 [Candidatus Hecatella orcuttiae]|jgi:ribosomal protein uS10|uniref:30S ribosomal protein S10 n=1 Tax=Candidatus Hecatella orcuttiae TaxID=1935119 RepID=UPI002867B7B5|nr:30S ribosomal protein S10 [Candidatus Hecatella orcuttiae]
MVQKARIRLTSVDCHKLDGVCREIKDISGKIGIKISGPIPLPTKRILCPTRKTPCGEGTATWDRWELRVHKRLIEVEANERLMKRIMRIKVPDEVFIEISLVS